MLHHEQDQAQGHWVGSGAMEEMLECPIDPGGTGRHQPLAPGEGHNHSQGKGSHLQATCLQQKHWCVQQDFLWQSCGKETKGPSQTKYINENYLLSRR